MDLLGSDISLDDVKNVPDSPEYSLAAILAEYGEAPAAASGVEARSREIVMEALGETISAGPGEVIHIPKGSEIQFSVRDRARFLYFVYPADWQK